MIKSIDKKYCIAYYFGPSPFNAGLKVFFSTKFISETLQIQ